MSIGLGLTNSTGVTINNCTAGSGQIVGGSAITVAYSTFSAVANGFSVTNGTGVEFISDTVTAVFGEAILLQNGRNNEVLQTTITGGYDGNSRQVGADDGIALENESGDTIQGNTISNFFDAGIEAADALMGSTIASNTLSNIGTAGIASYWCTDWTQNVIRGNTVSMSPLLIEVLYQTQAPQCQAPFAPSGFAGNQFIDNVFRSPIVGLGPAGPQGRMQVHLVSGSITGNLLQGNDFGTNDGPSLTPLSGFVDGGGNLCGPLNPVFSDFPCAATGPSAAVHGRLHAQSRAPGR